MSLNPFSLDIMTSPLHPIYQGCDNYDYSGNHMGERKVVVTLQSESPIDFMIGDYITYNGEKFTLQTAPITGRIFSSHMLSYTLTFWWAGYELQLANFLDVIPSGDDSSVYYNKTSEVIINDTILRVCGRIIANLDRSGYGGWSFDIHGSVDIVTPKDVEAINLQCYDVLQNISTVFGVEYQFDNATKTIKIGYPPEVTTLFEYGKDKGICEINRVQNDQKVITRVRAYGSTRNITPEYRHVPDTLEYHARLILPEDQSPLPAPNEQYSIIDGYLVDTVKEAAYGIREGVPYINEDIYPSIEGLNNTVFAVGGVTDRPTESTPQYNTVVVTPEWTEWRLKYAYQGEIWQEAHPDAVPEYIEIIHPAVVKEELIETVPQGTYDTATFFVPDLGFDLNDESIKTGEAAKICFTTGNLVSAGELTIASFTKYMTLIAGVPTWDDGFGNQLWKVTVIRNSDDPNHIMPSEAVPIQVGDKYVFLNIFLPTIYEDAAEAKLLAAAIEYLKANTKSPEGYVIRLSEEYFTKYPLTLGKFKEGNAVTIRDTLLGLTERAVLIQSMSVSYKDNAHLPVYNLTISDVPIKGSLDVLRSGLKQSNQTITSRIATVENTTNSVLKSAYILNSRILDNNLDIRGSIIAAQSITPISQSVELKSAHYMLQAIFTVNYEGAVNAANGSAGVLIHKEEDVVWANTYDLTHQTWTITAPQTFALLDGVRYYVYIKGSLTDGTAVWIVSETKITATQDQGFYYFEWGSILAPIEGVRLTQGGNGASFGTHLPVSVDPASAAFASIDPNTQVLTVNEQAGIPHNPVTIASGSASRASIDANQVLTIESQVSDEAYSGAWDGVENLAPSKNAVYDKIHDMEPVNYAPTSITVIFGTLNQGTFSDLAEIGGADVIIQERVTNPPFEVVIGFSGVHRLSGFKFYGEYDGSPSHVVHVEGYNYTTASWDFLGEISSNGGKHWYAFNFNLANNYLSAETVQVRLQHQGSGSITHQMIIDYANVNYGGGGGANFIGAGAVAFTPDVNISATNVQAAIQELDDEKIGEAPIDGSKYARKDGDWVTFEEGSGGSAPATIDSTTMNIDNGTTHTHELGKIAIEDVISGSPVVYGALYNWYAATDVRKITSSDDWVVPTWANYGTLSSYLGGMSLAGGKLKETGYDYWDSPNTGATNESGFNGRGSGIRTSGIFNSIKEYSYFMSTDAGNFIYFLYNLDAAFPYGGVENTVGSSIRLLYVGAGAPTSYTGSDGKLYGVVQIGSQYWINSNLAETRFRNGEYIHGYEGGVYTPISNANWAALTTEAMCYYDDNEAYGGGQTPLSNQHNSLAGLNTGDYQHLTAAELAKVQSPDKDWITLICRDVVAGTADSIPLNLKAYAGYTIDSLTLQTDNGTLTVTVKINGTAITGLSAISATTTITETAATALKTVAVGDLVTIEWSTAYTGTPTKIYAELNMTR